MKRVWRTSLILIAFNLLVTSLALATGPGLPGRELIYDAQMNGNADIVVFDVHHQLAFNLTRHESEDSRPTWSPDGHYIAFESWRDGTRSVYVMNADGRNLHRLTTHTEASEYAPEWTLDGTAILFRYYKNPESAIYRARPDGSDLQRVDPAALQQRPTQERIVSREYVDNTWGIYVQEGETTRRLTDSNRLYKEPPQWSADEYLVAFLSQSERAETEVYVISNEDRELRQMTWDGFSKSNLSWRP